MTVGGPYMSLNVDFARRAAAGAAVLGLLATACGGGTAEPADTASATTPSSVPAATDATSGGATEAAATDTPAAESRQVPETLAFALNAAENESYTFTQGLGINFGPAGVPFPQTEPYAFGEVADGQTHVRVDLEKFVGQAMSSLASFGLGPDLPTGQSFDVWIDDSTVTLDLQNLPTLESEVEAVANGPVSVDIAAVDAADLNAIVRQFGQGSIASDPNAVFDALGSLESMTEKGAGFLGTESVTEYVATVKVGDYYAAQGTSVVNQLGIVESIAIADETSDDIAQIVPALEELDLDVLVAIDADGRVRSVASDMNVTELVVSLFANSPELAGEDGAPAVDLGALFGPDGLQIVLSTWQEFHEYGTTTFIDAPEAVDVTTDVDSLFG